jgi:hypothetical protein
MCWAAFELEARAQMLSVSAKAVPGTTATADMATASAACQRLGILIEFLPLLPYHLRTCTVAGSSRGGREKLFPISAAGAFAGRSGNWEKVFAAMFVACFP